MIDESIPETGAPPRPANLPPAAPEGVARKVRVSHLAEMKRLGRPIAMVTAYDHAFAQLADDAGIDMILVGDTAAMVVHGHETTLPVTMDQMIAHVQAVARGAKRSFIVGDMPFLSYQTGVDEAVRNAGRFLKEGGAHAVKLEGASERVLPIIRAMVDSGIPVMGHLGLVPQSVHQLGGYRVQGRGKSEAARLLELARAQEDAGVFSIVLEAIPKPLATEITKALRIFTIGIGAGNQCDGQVLVMHDLLGLTPDPPRFARKYADTRAVVLRAFRKYARDVRERSFPGDEQSYE